MGATLKEGLQLKLVKKHGDAVSTAVVRGYKSGGPSLNHLQYALKFKISTTNAAFLFNHFKLLYAFSIHTRSSSPHRTDHGSQLVQEDFYIGADITSCSHIDCLLLA